MKEELLPHPKNPPGCHDYTAALDARTRLYGAHHMLTGWAHMLLGRAQAADHELPGGLANMQTGLAILKESIGTSNQRYLVSELAYSSLLDDAGSHAEAIRISTAANKTLSTLPTECPSCTTRSAFLRCSVPAMRS